MKQTGELLKKTREQKNLSLHEVGMSLKISPKTLQAIEEGDLSKLPQKAFVRGFVKSYAQFLKMETSAVLELLAKEQAGTTSEESSNQPKAEEISNITKEEGSKLVEASTQNQIPSSSLHTRAVNPIEKPHPFLNSSSIALFLVGLIVIASVILVSTLVSKYQKERGSEVAKQELLKTQEPTQIQSPSPVPTTTTATPDLSVAPEDASSSKLSGTSAAQQSASPTEMTLIKPTPQQETKKAETPAAPTSSQEKKTEEKPEEKPAVAITRPQEVIIEALASVAIQYKLGTGKMESIEMAAGEIHTFKSKSAIELDISDGGAINIIVNGRDRGVPSKPGKALHLNYPK